MATPTRWEVRLYETTQGRAPMLEFLTTLPVRHQAKMRQVIERLELFGPRLGFPDSSAVKGTSFRELRTRFAGQQYRVLYLQDGTSFVLFVASTRPATAISITPSKRRRSTWPPIDLSRASEGDMPTRPLTDLDRELRKNPDYEAELEELAPYEAIARQLIAFRLEHGLSQAELGRRCGVSQPAIARLERGEHEPRLATLRRVAHALDADLVLDFSFRTHKRRKHLATL